MSGCKTTSRFLYAKKNNLINNLESEACALGFSDFESFKKLGLKKLTICHPEKSSINKARKLNYYTFVNHKGIRNRRSKSFDITFVNTTKSRNETFFNIAVAFFITKKNGEILIIGDNKLGIDFFLKKISDFIKVTIFSKSHGKFGILKKPQSIPKGIKIWKNFGKYKKINSDFLTLPGCFSEKGVDQGSFLLASKFIDCLHGKVADLGAGWGYLSAKALEQNIRINQIHLIESNLNALNSARMNISSIKAKFNWIDIENENLYLKNFDHVIMNPPFHKDKQFKLSMGFNFIKSAKKILSKKGTMWMVFNKELSYEKSINDLFPKYEYIDITENYKIIKAKNNLI